MLQKPYYYIANKKFLIIFISCKRKSFFFRFVNETKIKQLIQRLNSKKATGIGTILAKLIKGAVDFLTPLLTKSINSSIEHNIFPYLTNTALVVPLSSGKPNKIEKLIREKPSKGKPRKNDISNF